MNEDQKMFMGIGNVPKNPADWPQDFFTMAVQEHHAMGAPNNVAICPQKVMGENGDEMVLLAAMPAVITEGADGEDHFDSFTQFEYDATLITKEELN